MSTRVMGIVGLAVLAFAWLGPLPHLVAQSFAAHMWLHMLVVGVAVPLLAAALAPRLAITSALALPVIVSLLDFIVVWGWHAPALHHASRSEPLVLVAEQASFFAVSLLVWLVALGGESTNQLSSPLRRGASHLSIGALFPFSPYGRRWIARQRETDEGYLSTTAVAETYPSSALRAPSPTRGEGRPESAVRAGERVSVVTAVQGNAALGGAIALFFTSMHMTLLGALLGLSPRPLYAGHHGGDGWLGLSPLADQQVGGVVMLAIGGVVYLCGGLVLMARVLRRAPS